MLRVVLLSLSLIVSSFLLHTYIEDIKAYRVQGKNLGMFDKVRIRSYSQKGIEWTVEGKALRVEGPMVELSEALLNSENAVLKAKKAVINRDTKEGRLEGDVELESKEFRAFTQRAEFDLKEGKVWGKDRIKLVQNNSKVEGEGFEIHIKPLRVIIEKSRTEME